MSQSGIPIVEDVAGAASDVSQAVTENVVDDLLGFDPSGGGIYDVTRDVLGDTIADDILGFDPGGGGIVPYTNAAADAVVKYLLMQGVTAGYDQLSNLATTSDAASLTSAADLATVSTDAANLAAVSKDAAMIQQNLIAAGVDPIMAAEAANQAVMGASSADIAANLATAFPYDKVYVSGGLTAGGSTMDPFAKEVGGDITSASGADYSVNPGKVVEAALKANSLLNPTPSGIPQQSIAGRAGGAVDYSGLLNLLTENRAARQRLSLV
jgi:hypothetical protein